MKMLNKIPRFRSAGIAVLILSMLVVSCNKDEKETLQTADALEELANEQYLKAEITNGDDQLPFYIPNDGLIDEYTAKESYFNTKPTLASNKLTGCLVNVNLSEEQRALAHRALVSYRIRNHELIRAHRAAVSELNQAMQQRRQHLMGLLRSGEIDRAEFMKRMADIRQRYSDLLMGIKEKHAFEFRRSYRFLLNQLFEILDEDQWNRFVTCMKG